MKGLTHLFMFQGDCVIEYLDKVRSDLNSGNVDHDRIGRFAGLGRSGVVDGDRPEPVHDPVSDSFEKIYLITYIKYPYLTVLKNEFNC